MRTRFARICVLGFALVATPFFAQPAAQNASPPAPPTSAAATPASANQPLRFVVTFPDTARAAPASGRLLLFLAQGSATEPRRASFTKLGPVYAIDVKDLKPGEPVTFSPANFSAPDALAFPLPLGRLTPGAYQAQAVLDLDTTERDYNAGPGNLYSRPQTCELRGTRGGTINVVADQVVGPLSVRADTETVKLVELPSKLLSDFHGRPIFLRGGVILPSTYATEPARRYAVIYQVPGFGGRHTSAWAPAAGAAGQRGPTGETPLQAIRVVLDPSCPLGHHVFANSANNGPVGDALVTEFIPEIERRFRAVPAAGARFVTGHSSGGWSSLWLQVTYPDTFGGCWSTSPDPVDFRAFQTMNLYADKNGCWTPFGQPRAVMRSRLKAEVTFPELQLWEYVIGYGSQLDSFDAVFSPRGADGRPLQVMDKLSGAINPAVVEHWKRYDIRLVLEKNWRTLGPKLRGKLHVMTGTWDTYYLNPAVELLRDFLQTTDYGGYVELLPGDHGTAITAAVRRRIDAEMAAAFAKFEARH